eukprot:363918-Chlamydomonas_euryale.AAC.4
MAGGWAWPFTGPHGAHHPGFRVRWADTVQDTDTVYGDKRSHQLRFEACTTGCSPERGRDHVWERGREVQVQVIEVGQELDNVGAQRVHQLVVALCRVMNGGEGGGQQGGGKQVPRMRGWRERGRRRSNGGH